MAKYTIQIATITKLILTININLVIGNNDNEESINNTDSDEEADPNYIYSENPLYISKGKLNNKEKIEK